MSQLEIKKTPVILTIVLTVITFGIYYPAWFLTRRQAINTLQSKEKLGSGVFVLEGSSREGGVCVDGA